MDLSSLQLASFVPSSFHDTPQTMSMCSSQLARTERVLTSHTLTRLSAPQLAMRFPSGLTQMFVTQLECAGIEPMREPCCMSQMLILESSEPVNRMGEDGWKARVRVAALWAEIVCSSFPVVTS